MIPIEAKLVIYNNNNRRFATLKEVVESLDLSSGDNGDDGVAITTGTVDVATALSTIGGRLTSSNLQKQGIFTKLELGFSNGNTTIQPSGSRLTVAVLPTGFRPTQTVHTFASNDNGDSKYPRHAILIESNGDVIWIPNGTGYFTLNFQVVF